MKIEFEVDSNNALLLIAFYDLIIKRDVYTNTYDCWEWLIDELMSMSKSMVKQLEFNDMSSKRSKYLSMFDSAHIE